MKFISTANLITQAFKNVGRMREISTVLAQYGFTEIVTRMKLARFLPGKQSVVTRIKDLPPEKRLRMAFEQLGTTFIKLGQVMATRPDLIPESYINEFQTLQDNVSTVPSEEIKKHLESELSQPIFDVFESFDDKPMAAASIAQVHGATLKDGTRLALKIQRPGISSIIENDISILRGIAVLLNRYIPETRIFNPMGIVDEFFKTISLELDFQVESNNIRRIRDNLKQYKKLKIPKVYQELSTSRLLVLERFDGIRLSNRAAISSSSEINPSSIVELGCDVFFHMVMVDGVFHGDFHAGNLFILPENKIGLIDFGIVGRLSKTVRESVSTMFIAIMDEDFDTLASEYVALSQETGEVDVNSLQKDLMDLISPYIGMRLGEVNIGNVLLRSTAVAARHHLIVPRELMLLFKAMMTIEGLGKSLDSEFDLLAIGTRLARKTLAVRYSKEQIVKDLIVVGRDLQFLLERSPRVFKRFLRKWSSNNFAFETRSKDLERLARAIDAFGLHFLSATFSFLMVAIGLTFIILDKAPKIWSLSFPGLLFILLAMGGLGAHILKQKKNLRND